MQHEMTKPWGCHRFILSDIKYLLIVSKYFIREFTMENIFVWSKVWWWFLSMKWLTPQMRHLEFWREKQRKFSVARIATKWSKSLSTKIKICNLHFIIKLIRYFHGIPRETTETTDTKRPSSSLPSFTMRSNDC